MLSYQDYRTHIEQLAHAGIQASDPQQLVQKYIHLDGDELILPNLRYHLPQGKVYLVSIGKAAIGMGKAVYDLLGEDNIEGFVIASKLASPTKLPAYIRYYQAGHPLPNRQSVTVAQAIEQLLLSTTPQDLVLCLLSGGASALMCDPIVPLADYQSLNQALLKAGCPIDVTNTIRRQFDRIKGGGLATMAAPAACVTLILSDVLGNDVQHIGSGPTVPVPKDAGKVSELLEMYDIWQHIPSAAHFSLKYALTYTDTEIILPEVLVHCVVGDITVAMRGVQEQALALGFDTHFLDSAVQGEAQLVGIELANKLREEHLPPHKRPACFLFGGEATVTVTGKGLGGRNQEVALTAALALEGTDRCVVAAIATDGEDGLSSVAGAVVTSETIAQARAQGLDAGIFLADNNSYTFFHQLENAHLQLPRGTNVNDLFVLLKY